MKSFIFISFLLTTFSLFSQTETTQKPSIMGYYSHNFSSLKYYSRDKGENVYPIDYSFTVGINFRVLALKNTYLRSGFNYSKNTVEYPYQGTTGSFGMPTIRVYENGRYNYYDIASQTEDILQVPIIIEYHFLNTKRLSLYALSGVAANFFLNEKIEYFDGAGKTVMYNKNYSKYYRWLYEQNEMWFGLGIDYTFSKKIKLNIEPCLKLPNYQQSSINSFKPKTPFFFGRSGFFGGFSIGTSVIYTF